MECRDGVGAVRFIMSEVGLQPAGVCERAQWQGRVGEKEESVEGGGADVVRLEFIIIQV